MTKSPFLLKSDQLARPDKPFHVERPGSPWPRGYRAGRADPSRSSDEWQVKSDETAQVLVTLHLPLVGCKLPFPQSTKMHYHLPADAGTVGNQGPGWPREKRR